TRHCTTRTARSWRRGMVDSVVDLFRAYADAHARGARPRARDYLDRAAESEREQLALLIDRFLAATPVGRAGGDELALVEAWTTAEQPLLALRLARRLKRADLIETMLAAFQLPATKREKLAGR